MTKKVSPIRLQQLELLLRWENFIGNARIRELFGFTSVRASQWIREFRDAHPNWMNFDSKTRVFRASSNFHCHASSDTSLDLSKYLSLVGLPVSTGLKNSQIIASAFPEISTPKPFIFATLSNAIKFNQTVEITYRSMSDPKEHKRVIEPHSLIKAGRRWHVRAYCQNHNEFRDYTLGRITYARSLPVEASHLITEDAAWNKEVLVKFIAHPDLSFEQQSVICYEYFADTAARTVSCRGALVNYFIQDMRAAIDIKSQHPPEFQLAIGNLMEIKRWLPLK